MNSTSTCTILFSCTKVPLKLCDDESHKNTVLCHLKQIYMVPKKCTQSIEMVCEKNPKHKYEVKCCQRDEIGCQEPCSVLLPCQHRCTGKCGECVFNEHHKICRDRCVKTLTCGHRCTVNFTRCLVVQYRYCFVVFTLINIQ